MLQTELMSEPLQSFVKLVEVNDVASLQRSEQQ